MRTILINISLILFLINISPSKLELTDESNQEQGGHNLNNDENPIKYNLISDERDGPNRFKISYEVRYDEFIFKRSEKCQITELNNSEQGSSEMVCSGKTKFSRTDGIKNITNFDDYTYSSYGFNHSGEIFIVSGNYYRFKKIDVTYGLEPEPIFLKLNISSPAKNLQIEHIGKDKLSVNLTIDSTFFSMNRTEQFSMDLDDETNSTDLTCSGAITLTTKNSENYQTIQRELFILGEEYTFIYATGTELIDNNGTSATTNF